VVTLNRHAAMILLDFNLLLFQSPYHGIVIGCWILWGVSEWGHSILLQDTGADSRNKYSTLGIYTTVFMLFFIYSFTPYFPAYLVFKASAAALFIVGLVIFWGGFLLRWTSIYLMGNAFSRKIKVEPDQKIIKRGPFGYIRHPNYLAGLMTFFGLALMFGSWISLGVIGAMSLIVYLYRIHVEENFLQKNLAGYHAYCKEVRYRLIPFIF